MIDPHESLESELRGLQPAPVSARLAGAVARALDNKPSTNATRSPAGLPLSVKFSLWASWSITATAASLALVFGLRLLTASTDLQSTTAPNQGALQSPREAAPAETPTMRMEPVSSRGYLFAAEDEGVVLLDDGLPARKVRYQFVDTVQLRAPGDAASARVSFPREEIRLISVKLY